MNQTAKQTAMNESGAQRLGDVQTGCFKAADIECADTVFTSALVMKKYWLGMVVELYK